MIDNFSLGLTHVLLLYAAWRLMGRADLDRADLDQTSVPGADIKPRGWGKR